jgi:VanZ family protein
MLAAAAWSCIVLLAFLSLLPGDKLVRTGASGWIEHVGAYCGSMLVIAAAYERRLGRLALVAGLVCYAGVLEIAQIWSPGRQAALSDWLASSAGSGLGMLLFILARRLRTAVLATGVPRQSCHPSTEP